MKRFTLTFRLFFFFLWHSSAEADELWRAEKKCINKMQRKPKKYIQNIRIQHSKRPNWNKYEKRPKSRDLW